MKCFACDNQDAVEGKHGPENITTIKRVYLNGLSHGLLVFRLVTKHGATYSKALEFLETTLCEECRADFQAFINHSDTLLQKIAQ